jgi:hypothetical protein
MGSSQSPVLVHGLGVRSFFNLSLPTPSEVIVELQLEGEYEGCQRGTWYSTPLHQHDIPGLGPVYDHIPTLFRIQEALAELESHWFLAAWGPCIPVIWRNHSLLVRDLGSDVFIKKDKLQIYAYVGTLAAEKDTVIFGKI